MINALKISAASVDKFNMIIVYASVAIAMFIWAAVLPTRAALAKRESNERLDQLRALELKYVRRAYPTLRALSSDEIDSRFGLERAYRSIQRR